MAEQLPQRDQELSRFLRKSVETFHLRIFVRQTPPRAGKRTKTNQQKRTQYCTWLSVNDGYEPFEQAAQTAESLSILPMLFMFGLVWTYGPSLCRIPFIIITWPMLIPWFVHIAMVVEHVRVIYQLIPPMVPVPTPDDKWPSLADCCANISKKARILT